MKKIISLLLCFLMLMTSCAVFAEDVTGSTEEGTIDPYESVERVLEEAETYGEYFTIKRSDTHYYRGAATVEHKALTANGSHTADQSEGCSMNIIKKSSSGTAVQLRFTASGVDVNKGDVIFFAFKVKPISSEHSTGNVVGSGSYRFTEIVKDENDNDKKVTRYNAGIKFRLPVPEEDEELETVWCYKAVKASYAHTKDKNVAIDFVLGEAEQKLEISDITLINFKDNFDIAYFPKEDTPYNGMGPEGDAWREEAEKRIEQIRKSDVKIKVVDPEGNPIPDADVKIEQKEHKFRFGTYMPKRRFEETEDMESWEIKRNKQFKELLLKMFNTTGFENLLKPDNIIKTENKAIVDEIVAWADKNDLNLRGHTLVYELWQAIAAMTADEKTAYDNAIAVLEDENATDKQKAEAKETKKQTLIDSITRHIQTYTAEYGDKIDSWDVINEHINHKDQIFAEIGGDDEAYEVYANWFRAAAANTDGKLAINDFGIISYDESKQQAHYNLAEELLKRNAPITTVGMQAHLSEAVPPDYVYSILEKFSDLGLEIEITEFTYENSNTEVQKNYIRDFLTAVFSHPSTSGIYLWGFVKYDIGNRQNSALALDWNSSVTGGFELKPSGEMWMKKIYEDWWTNEAGKSDGNGFYKTRAFHGDHNITVTANGKTYAFPIELDTAAVEYVVIPETDTCYEVTESFGGNGLRISLDEEQQKLTVEGNSGFGGGADATMLINDSDGRIVYFNQVPRLATDGSFSMNVKTSNFLTNDSQYTVKIGSQGKNCVKFWLWGDSEMFDYNIESVDFNNASGELNSFGEITADDTVTAKVKLKTNSVQTIFMGLFDAEGNLLKVDKADGEITGTDEVTCTASISMEDTVGGDHIRLFVWDDELSLVPFTETILFN